MSNLLRQKALESGLESRVQVNQRMLIDKMLARYSSDFVVCRELMQNADDAQASSFHFEITCHGTYSTEKDFHLKSIDEIRAVNNGLVFSETDWKRVAAIAEGNTNVESVGQFGVGFFSVFSFSEEPIITSGKDYMAFVWRNDHSLTTYRHQLPEDQQTSLTSIILKMRPDYVLNTETDVDFDLVDDENQKSSNKKKKKNRTVVEEVTVPMIHLNQLKAFFTKGSNRFSIIRRMFFLLVLF